MSTALTYGLLGGGLLAGGAAALLGFGWAWKRASDHVNDLTKGVGQAPAYAGGKGGTFKVHATGYWPFTARSDEKKMEGKPEDRIGAPLYTIEDFLAGKSDHVSISGDLDVFPYGQKLLIDGWPGIPNLVGRVTDTGGHFHDAGGLSKRGSKVYRVIGEEPLDFCVLSSNTFVPKKGISARIVAGDHWASRTKKTVQDVVSSKIRDQVVGATDVDREMLARAVESCCPRGTIFEKQAVAWAIRNRAARAGVPVAYLLAPEGACGPRGSGGRDYASTAMRASTESTSVARAVLALPDSRDPTGGAVDFWCPEQQARLRVIGEARAAMLGVECDLPSVDEVRVGLAAVGLRPCMVVGTVELLKRA